MGLMFFVVHARGNMVRAICMCFRQFVGLLHDSDVLLWCHDVRACDAVMLFLCIFLVLWSVCLCLGAKRYTDLWCGVVWCVVI